MKSLHLTPFLATVQRGPEVLQVLGEDLGRPGSHRPGDAMMGLWTHLTLPAAARLWSLTEAIPEGKPGQPVELRPGDPYFVRLGEVVAGVRFVYAEDQRGGVPRLYLMRDRPLDAAKRLTLEHATATATGKGVVAVWLRVAGGLDETAFGEFRKRFAAAAVVAKRKGDLLELSAEGLQGKLGMELDLKRGERLRLEGGEPGVSQGVLVVNGHDVAQELLGRAEAH